MDLFSYCLQNVCVYSYPQDISYSSFYPVYQLRIYWRSIPSPFTPLPNRTFPPFRVLVSNFQQNKNLYISEDLLESLDGSLLVYFLDAPTPLPEGQRREKVTN